MPMHIRPDVEYGVTVAASLVGFIEQSVARGNIVHTDGWGGYRPLRNKGYDHQRQTQGRGTNGTKLFPTSALRASGCGT